jgi:hypothetical protein
MLPNFQGFWLALSAYEDTPNVFASLLALCEEFSVTLDYNTPTSGGEWVVMVAHFGDRTTFRFPRLSFNARDAYNQLSQRLLKAEKKAKPEVLNIAGTPSPIEAGSSQSTSTPTTGEAGSEVAVSDEGKSSSEAGTPEEAATPPSESGTAPSADTTSASTSDLKEPKAKPDNKTRRQ